MLWHNDSHRGYNKGPFLCETIKSWPDELGAGPLESKGFYKDSIARTAQCGIQTKTKKIDLASVFIYKKKKRLAALDVTDDLSSINLLGRNSRKKKGEWSSGYYV